MATNDGVIKKIKQIKAEEWYAYENEYQAWPPGSFYVEITRDGGDYEAKVCDTKSDGEIKLLRGNVLYTITGDTAEGLFGFVWKKVNKLKVYEKRKAKEEKLKSTEEKNRKRIQRLKDFME